MVKLISIVEEILQVTDVENKFDKRMLEFVLHINSVTGYKELKKMPKDSNFEKIINCYLDGVFEIIKEYYINGTLKAFKEATKIGNLNYYYKVWDIIFSYKGWNREELNNRTKIYDEIILKRSGIPKHLTQNTVLLYTDFYLKYDIKNSNNIDDNFEKIKSIEDYLHTPKEYKHLKDLIEKLSPFKERVNEVFNKMDLIQEYLHQNKDLSLEKLENTECICDINKTLGFNIFAVIPNKKELLKLYNTFSERISLIKFIRILKNLPNSSKIKKPDREHYLEIGSLNLNNLIYGVYQIEKTVYEVVPFNGISLNDILSMKRNTWIELNEDTGIFVSKNEFDVQIGEELFNSIEMYFNNTELHIWYGNKPKARKFIVAGIEISPKKRYDCNFKIGYKYSYEERKYKLVCYSPIVRIYSKELRGKKVELSTNFNEKLINGIIDNSGYLYKENVCFEIENFQIESNKLKIYIKIDGIQKYEFEIELQNYYLFDKLTKQAVYENRINNVSNELIIISLVNLNVEFGNEIVAINPQEYKILNVVKCDKIIIDNSIYNLSKEEYAFLISDSKTYNTYKKVKLQKAINLKDISNAKILIETENEKYFFSIADSKEMETFNFEDYSELDNLKEYFGDIFIYIYNNGKKYSSEKIKIIPQLKLELERNIYCVGEQIYGNVYYLNFSNEKIIVEKHKFITIALKNSDEKKIEGKEIYCDYFFAEYETDVHLEYTEKVNLWNACISRDKEIDIKEIEITNLSDLKDYKISVICNNQAELPIKYFLNEMEIKQLDVKDSFNLDLIKEELRIISELRVEVADFSKIFKIRWNPIIQNFEGLKEINKLILSFEYEGPIGIDLLQTVQQMDNKIQRREIKVLKNKDIIKWEVFNFEGSEAKVVLKIAKSEREIFVKKIDLKNVQIIEDDINSFTSIADFLRQNKEIYTHDKFLNDFMQICKISKEFIEKQLLIEVD